jgi:hypothetical protein
MGHLLEGAIVKLHAWPAAQLAKSRLPGPSLVIQFADDEGLMPEIYDKENVVGSVQVYRPDDAESFTPEDAKRIIFAVLEAMVVPRCEHIVAQCMAGVGRSVATCMALAKAYKWDFDWRPTYNRRIYKTLLHGLCVAPEREPLVSIAVRVKYAPEALFGFLLSLRRQRWDNYEAVCFTDGMRPDIRELVKMMPEVVLIENSERKGRWGHYHRQRALEVCRGEWIGTNNDDNYLTPGYIEQMVHVGEQSKVDVVTCGMLHRYSGWQPVPAGTDLCAWLARGPLVHRVPWTGVGFTADQEYLQALLKESGGSFAEVRTPLVVKN